MASLSIIIPVLNEEKRLSTLLPVLKKQSDSEIIVSIGDSMDRSFELANQFGNHVIVTNSGRANQMNEGAKLATGEVLLFLHADCLVPENISETILRACREPGVVGGALKLKFDSSRLSLRYISWTANLRAKYLNLPYGDQGIFIRRDVFEQIGRFPDTPFMEDVLLVRMMAKRGKLKILTDEIVTSARRWEENGVFRTSGRNVLLIALYFLGFSPARLKKWYI
jgi:rSAM/selenodomain-associated transferase 2